VVFFVTTAVTPLPVAEPESPLIEASAAVSNLGVDWNVDFKKLQ
jgi:hypothetical protein